MGADEADQLADVLSKRRECLAALVEGPRDKRDLVATLDIPRSTLDRAIRELEEVGLVVYDEGQYRATTTGRLALEEHDRYRESLASFAAAGTTLASLPEDTLLGSAFLRGARVVESEPYAPDGVVAELLESVRTAEVVRGVAPVAMTGHTDEFRTVATDGGGRLELVFAPAVFDHLASAQTQGLLDAIESPAVDFYRGELPFSFGLWLADDREAGVVVYDETGIRGVVANDTEAAIRWARDQYDRVARTATRVGVEDVTEVAGVSN
jgi:predicted transcriptional regulator